jgi:hypothetical protein
MSARKVPPPPATRLQGAPDDVIRKYATEGEARAAARALYPERHVYIIESAGAFYLEAENDRGAGFLRSWEREVYAGFGAGAPAIPGKART